MAEITNSFERDLEWDDRHLYDGLCVKCRTPAIRRGAAWFHTTVVWSCRADEDIDHNWFQMAEDPLGNCHCEKCSTRRLRLSGRDA